MSHSFGTPHNLFSIPDTHPESVSALLSSNTTPATRDHPFIDTTQHSPFVAQDLISIARSLVLPRGKGIYATDEAPEDFDPLLDSVTAKVTGKVAGDEEPGAVRGREEEKERRHELVEISDEEREKEQERKLQRRKKWRQDIYEAVNGDHISGVILYSETLHHPQFSFLAEILTQRGVIPGIRANGPLTPFPNSPSEFIVQGLDGLLATLQSARLAGARFSKWRVPIACTSLSRSNPLPTTLSIQTQAQTLAQFAAISQQAGLVPIVEPDVEFGEDASLERSVEVHINAVEEIYRKMREWGVLLEGSLIKPSFPQPGRKHPSRDTTTPEQIALATATFISRSVPNAVPGVVFLSGGLSSPTSVAYLSALNKLINHAASAAPGSPFSRLPPLSFSFGRALQGGAMEKWVAGDVNGAQEDLRFWSEKCWRAVRGEEVNI